MTGSGTKTETIRVRGMFCTHCETRVREALLALPGVISAEASFEKETALVTYDPSQADEQAFRNCIEAAGYEIVNEGGSVLQSVSILIILLALWLIAEHFGWTTVFNLFPRIETTFSLGALFLTGGLTSVHCVAMCGGINLTQSVLSASVKAKLFRSNALYQAGRVISYTLAGALAGGLGSVLSAGNRLKGIIEIIAGCAMLAMALSMLGIFRPLRRIRFDPAGNIHSAVLSRFRTNSSFIIGLLNGLMPCGPLQSMQIYALSTGSVWKGALSMLFFSLGTVPLMLGFGLISGKLNRAYTRVMLTVSAFLIFIMGLNMMGNGFSLTGAALPQKSRADVITAMRGEDIQKLRMEIDHGSYPAVRIKAGIPVEWTIVVPEGKLNGCNGEIIVPAYDIDIVLHEGENRVTFTAGDPGLVPSSCWMGMIHSTIEVTD